ncbi:MAG: phage tail tape measure protein, partial [Parcubacteria group bacterium]
MPNYGGAVLPLSVDDSALQRSLAGVLGSFQTLGKQVDGVMGNLGRFTIAATGLYAIKKAFDATTDAALSFNRALSATWAVAGDLSKGELRALGGEVRNLARQFNMTSTQAQQAMYEINQSVFYGSDALEILKQSAKGAAAGLTDVYTVADMMTTVLNAYGMEASKSAHINDVLFQTVLYGKVTMNELATEFGRLAGVAAPVGASLEEVSAAIATLTRLGIDTDTAVTAIRQSLFQILRPSKALETAINAMGYSTGRAMVEANGFAKSLQLLVDYGNATGIEMESLFSNIRAVLAVLPLTSTAADEYAQDLQRVGDSAGAADTAFKKITSSWQYQIENTKVVLNDLAISFGQLLVPAIQAFLKTLQMALTPLAHVAEFLGKIGGQQLVGLVTVLGTATLAVLAFRKAAAALNNTLTVTNPQLGAMFYHLGKGSMLNGAGLLGLGALGIGAAIKGITVDLPIALDPKVTGAEKVKAALQSALETGLGAALGGAVFGKMLGLTAGAGALAGVG